MTAEDAPLLTGAADGGDATASGVVTEMRLRLQGGAQAASAARRALSGLGGQIDRALFEDIRLLVSELVTNSVRHAGVGPSGLIGLDVALEDDHIRIEVSNRGERFEPRARTSEQSKGSGWGLFLVDKLADRWGVAHDDLSRVWFEIDHR